MKVTKQEKKPVSAYRVVYRHFNITLAQPNNLWTDENQKEDAYFDAYSGSNRLTVKKYSLQ